MARLCIASHVKNEQYLMSDWCNTHRYADELLVVDTGSSDATVVIAEQAGAHIRQANIDEGFAVVRTACITFARELGCDWVMILDADERVLRWAPEFTVQREDTPLDMTTKWPAGPGAPTHAKYQAVRTGRMIHQENIIRGAIEDAHIVAYQTRRRHWFDWGMNFPCQAWNEYDWEEGIPDWQNRMCRTSEEAGLHYRRRVHEHLCRQSDGGPPEPNGAFGPDGCFWDHFHVPAKRWTPGRAEEVAAFCGVLHRQDIAEGVTY